VNFLPSYLVNSAILKSGKNPKACAEGAVKMFSKGKIKDIELTACYCCVTENRVSFIFNGPSKDAILHVVQEQLDIPVASITEAEEVSVLP
jgi:hypothetical protein